MDQKLCWGGRVRCAGTGRSPSGHPASPRRACPRRSTCAAPCRVPPRDLPASTPASPSRPISRRKKCPQHCSHPVRAVRVVTLSPSLPQGGRSGFLRGGVWRGTLTQRAGAAVSSSPPSCPWSWCPVCCPTPLPELLSRGVQKVECQRFAAAQTFPVAVCTFAHHCADGLHRISLRQRVNKRTSPTSVMYSLKVHVQEGEGAGVASGSGARAGAQLLSSLLSLRPCRTLLIRGCCSAVTRQTLGRGGACGTIQTITCITRRVLLRVGAPQPLGVRKQPVGRWRVRVGAAGCSKQANAGISHCLGVPWLGSDALRAVAWL